MKCDSFQGILGLQCDKNVEPEEWCQNGKYEKIETPFLKTFYKHRSSTY